MEETVGKVHRVSYEAVFSSRPAGQFTLFEQSALLFQQSLVVLTGTSLVAQWL